jgi:hypothetical protein
MQNARRGDGAPGRWGAHPTWKRLAHWRLSELSARYEGAGARLAASHAAPIKLLQFCGKLRGRSWGRGVADQVGSAAGHTRVGAAVGGCGTQRAGVRGRYCYRHGRKTTFHGCAPSSCERRKSARLLAWRGGRSHCRPLPHGGQRLLVHSVERRLPTGCALAAWRGHARAHAFCDNIITRKTLP